MTQPQGNRAAGVASLGGPVISLTLPDERHLTDDLVRMEIKAAGVGNWDELVRVGRWEVRRPTPTVLGVEGAGVVVATGPSVRGVSVGDQVLFHSAARGLQGSWAQFCDVPAGHVAGKPEGVGWAQAGAFPVPALTASQAVDAVCARQGSTLFVHGAGGVTGGLAVQLAVARGVRVLATAGPSSASRVKGFGADAVFDYHDATWPAAVLRRAPDGVEAAINATRGGEAAALSVLSDGGRLATITGDPPATGRSVTVADIYVRPDGAALAALVALLARGVLNVDVAATYPLAQAGQALAAAVSGKAGGAGVICP